jgi:hypothetical protein
MGCSLAKSLMKKVASVDLGMEMARDASVRVHRHWVSVCASHNHFMIRDLF